VDTDDDGEKRKRFEERKYLSRGKRGWIGVILAMTYHVNFFLNFLMITVRVFIIVYTTLVFSFFAVCCSDTRMKLYQTYMELS